MNFFQLIKIKIVKVFGIFKRTSNKPELNPAMDLVAAPATSINLDPRLDIISASNKQLNKLKLLSSFFNNDLIISIKDQTEIVNEIFSKNKDLNYKKLEQFNYYYTENLLELLGKLKKVKEENILILNEKLIKAKNNIADVKINKIDLKKIENERKKYANVVSEFLAAIYRDLTGYFNNIKNPHAHRDTKFLDVCSYENYYNIEFDFYEKLASINQDTCYFSNNYALEKKLVGKLNKNVFNIQYLYTFRTKNGDEAYIFLIKDTVDYFVYVPDKMSFKLIEPTEVIPLAISANSSWSIITNKLETELNKVEQLEDKIKNEKYITDPTLISTLEEYLKKVSDDSILSSLSEIDVDRQFLDEVLKLEQFKI